MDHPAQAVAPTTQTQISSRKQRKQTYEHFVTDVPIHLTSRRGEESFKKLYRLDPDLNPIHPKETMTYCGYLPGVKFLNWNVL